MDSASSTQTSSKKRPIYDRKESRDYRKKTKRDFPSGSSPKVTSNNQPIKLWCWVYRPIYMRYTSNSLTFTINLPVDELLSCLFMFVLLGNKSMIHHELLQIWWCNIQVAVSRILRSNSWFTFVLPLANQTLNMRCAKRKRKWLNERFD